MRVLFFESHPMWINGLPNGFADAGHQVKVSGPLTEQNVPMLIREFCPDLIFTMGWGPEHKKQKQEWLRKYIKASRVPHIYWSTEDPTHTNTFSLPYIKNVQPNFVFTICPAMVDFYKERGIKAAYLDFGFHPAVHYPSDTCEQYICEIAVVANAYPRVFELYPGHYRLKSLKTLIYPALHEKMHIDFWGRDWDRLEAFLGENIPKECIHGSLEYTEANKVYSSANIVIGLQNHATQVTQRTYEILGSGGFLLTDDTPEIRRLFNPGKDLVISSSYEDTVRLIRYYMENNDERNQIRKNGMRAVANHSYRYRAEHIIDVLLQNDILKAPFCSNDKKGIGVHTSKNSPSMLVGWGNTSLKQIAFTFDVGDSNTVHIPILDVLKRHGVKSTFFVTGEWVDRHSDLMKLILEAGHEVGNHTYSHPNITLISHHEIIKEIIDCESAIKHATGKGSCRLFRPPFGAIDKQALLAVGSAGFEYCIYWSIDTVDWKQHSKAFIIKKILDNARNGDIVLMHLSGSNTAAALDMVIPQLKGNGYKLVKLTEMLEDSDIQRKSCTKSSPR